MRSVKILIGVVVCACLFVVTIAVIKATPPPPRDTVTTPAADADGQAPAPLEPATPNAETEPDPLEPAGTYVRGTVVDDYTDAPITGARIHGLPRHERRSREVLRGEVPEFVAETDAEGVYALAQSGGGFYRVVCSAPGYIHDFELIRKTGIEDITVDFRLRPGSTVTGCVTDIDTGGPVEGVEVELRDARDTIIEHAMATWEGGDTGLRAMTDAEGSYAIKGVPNGSYIASVKAREQGYLHDPKDAVGVSVPETGLYEDVDFALLAGGRCEGRITNEAGEPVEGAVIAPLPVQVISGFLKDIEAYNLHRFDEEFPESKADGTYAAIGLEYSMEYRLRVRADGYAWGGSGSFTVERGAGPAGVDVVLLKGCSLSGTVTYPDGQPTPGHRVTLFPESFASEETFVVPPEREETEKDGSFTFEHICAGEYMIWTGGRRSPGMVASRAHVSVDGRTDVEGIELVVERPEGEGTSGNGTLTGRVLDHTGKPVADVRVMAFATRPPRERESARTDVAGAFSIEGLSAARYQVEVHGEEGWCEEKNVAVNTTIVLRLNAPSSVTGVVLDEAGSPVPDCGVMLHHARTTSKGRTDIRGLMNSIFNRRVNSTPTDAQGAFEFTAVYPGRYSVKAESATRGSGETPVFEVYRGKSVEGLRIVLESGVSVAGEVFNARGEPVRGAVVRLVLTGEGRVVEELLTQVLPAALQRGAGSAVTDAAGRFEIQHIPTGSYHLIVNHPDYATYRQEGLTLAPGRDRRGLRIQLRDTGSAKGTVMRDGKPLAGSMVMFLGPGGFQMAATNGQGQFEIRGLTPGSYIANPIDGNQLMWQGDLDVSKIDLRPQVVDVTEGGSADVTFGGGTGTAVSGYVEADSMGMLTWVALRRAGGVNPASINPANVADWIELTRSLAGQSLVGPDGSFDLGNVEPGAYVAEVYTVSFDAAAPEMDSLMNMVQTPAYQQEVTVTDQPVSLELGG